MIANSTSFPIETDFVEQNPENTLVHLEEFVVCVIQGYIRTGIRVMFRVPQKFTKIIKTV